MREFFEYLQNNLKESDLANTPSTETEVKISADFFGMTTIAEDDMGIGQVLEDAFPYFDYIWSAGNKYTKGALHNN